MQTREVAEASRVFYSIQRDLTGDALSMSQCFIVTNVNRTFLNGVLLG